MIAFAKLVFVVAAALSAGNDQSWPIMRRVAGTLDAPFAREGTISMQMVCLPNAGLYIITARIGFKPLLRGAQDVNGQLWLKGGAAGELYLAPLYASAERWNVDGATHQFVAPRAACYSLQYDLDGPATVNEDPRATYIAITFVGAVEDPR